MKVRTVAIVIAVMAGGAQGVAAQGRLSLNIAGGLSIPQGALRDRAYNGWHGLAMVNLSSPMQPMGVRFDLAYNRFGFDDSYAATVGSGHQSTTSATLNFTYRVPTYDAPFSPYLLAGLGAYRTECSAATGCNAATRYGWNFGLGTNLYVLGFRSFVEARYHLTKFHGTPVHYFPLTFGVSLGGH